MNALATIVLLAWVPVSVTLFAVMKPRRAVLASYVVGWLFLPWTVWGIAGMPKVLFLTKSNVIGLGPMLGILLFDSARLMRLRPGAIDLPMVIWCCVPFASSISNGLGAYDGFTEALGQTMTWGLPYIAGRLYFRDATALRELAIAIFLGGLVYVPFCLFEIRMSPTLHKLVYGGQVAWTGKRLGGWRPKVFMQNGLALGLWMSITSIVGIWLMSTRALRQLNGIKVGPLVAVLFVTTVFCKSLGAFTLFLLSTGALYGSRLTRTALPILLLAGIPLAYMTVRALQLWSGESVVLLVAGFDEDRAWSLEYRLDNEDVLAARALQRPFLGWGGWNRSKAYNPRFKMDAISDGQWIIALGRNGVVGLAALTGVFLLPIFAWLRRAPVRRWNRPELAAGTVLSVALVMLFIDSLLNAFVNPILLLAAGGIPAARVGLARVARRRHASPGVSHLLGPSPHGAHYRQQTIAAVADRSRRGRS